MINPMMMGNPMGQMNPTQFMQKFMDFKKNFQGNPQQAVMNMLNSGQMSQEQFNQLQGMANQILNNFKGN